MPARRAFVMALGAVLGAASLRAWAQSGRVRRIAVLLPGDMDAAVLKFRAQLKEQGWSEGANLEIEVRNAQNRAERMPALAKELAARKPEVIVAASAAAARATMAAAPGIAVVFTLVPDPLASGLVASLNRPGGLLSGLSTRVVDTAPRQVELLKSLVPNLERIAELRQPAAPGAEAGSAQLRGAAARAKLALTHMDVHKAEDIDGAFAAAARDRIGAMVVAPAPLLSDEIKRIAQLARKYRIGTAFSSREPVAAGGLAGYGLDSVDGLARSAHYVDRILRGAKPGELPVEQADRYVTVINRRTAAELGLKVPQTLMATADDVID